MIVLNSNAHLSEVKAVGMSNQPLSFVLSSLRRALRETLMLLFAFSTLSAAQTQVHLLPAPREAHFGAVTSLPVKIESPCLGAMRQTNLPQPIWKKRFNRASQTGKATPTRRRGHPGSRNAQLSGGSAADKCRLPPRPC
jgi:hypothetical protein